MCFAELVIHRREQRLCFQVLLLEKQFCSVVESLSQRGVASDALAKLIKHHGKTEVGDSCDRLPAAFLLRFLK